MEEKHGKNVQKILRTYGVLTKVRCNDILYGKCKKIIKGNCFLFLFLTIYAHFSAYPTTFIKIHETSITVDRNCSN